MFRCDLCNNLSSPGEKINFIIIKKRPKQYFETKIIKDRKSKTQKEIKELIGEGWEIVKELKVCNNCKDKI